MSGRRNQASSGFDRLAAPYRFLEYLTLGPLLMHTRLAFLPDMRRARHALVLGDGDGRFCEALLRTNPDVHVDAVGSSRSMLHQLERRAEAAGGRDRVRTHLLDVRGELPEGPFDLVCTHFLLDCLNEAEVKNLAISIRTRMEAGQWIVSEFAIPPGLAGWPARLMVWSLYVAFGVLAGLRTRKLPRHAQVFRNAGFSCTLVRTHLFGMLQSEVWCFRKTTASTSKLEKL